MRRSVLAMLLAVLAAVACSDSTGPESTGAIQVELAISGVDGHTGPFTVAIDGGTPIELSASGAIIGGIQSGHHSIRLSGLAPNCDAIDKLAKAFAVAPPDTTVVSLPVSCSAVTGVVEIRATTAGPDPDLDGYDISVDGGPPRPVGPNGVARFTELPGGVHTLTFGGLAPNCSPAGPNPLQVEVPVGGTIRGTASVSFAVTCTAVTGALRIRVPTTGPDPDQGYKLRLDDTPERGLAANAALVVTRLAGGAHTILLSDIAANCTASNPNPATVTVTIGDTTDVTLPVVCLPNPVLRVTVSTTGTDTPVNFVALVDYDGWYGGASYAANVSPNGTVSLVVLPGEHVASLGVPRHCVVTSPTNVSVTLVAGTTTDLAFTVTCSTRPTLRVTVATTGANAPVSYLVGVDPDPWYGGYYSEATIASTGSVSIVLEPGVHEVTLDRVPLNCVVTSPNNVTLNVPPGATTELAFTVACQ